MLEHLEQQKRLTGNQWRIIATANLGDMLDFFDFFLIGYVLAFIIGSWQLTFGQSAMILLASGLGAVPGAFFWGWMADKIGRRKVFMATALNVAIATGIMAMTPGQDALVPGWLFLAFFRFFVGFGNAGLIAVDIPLVQEFVPAYKRGWVSGLTTVLLPAGNLLGAVSGAFLAPVIGWRGLFLVGLAPAALVLMIRYWVPESPHWLLRMGRMEDARKSLAWALAGRSAARSTLPTSHPRRSEGGAMAGVVPLSAQRRGVLPDRHQPDRRRRAAAVDHRAVRAGAADHAGRGLLPDDLREPRRHRRPAVLLVPVGCDRPAERQGC